MEIVGWTVTILGIAATAFVFGYWIGYRSGYDDAREGMRDV